MDIFSVKKPFVFLLAIFLVSPNIALAHKGHAHHQEESPPETPDAAKELADRLEKVNESYKRDVKPIFQRSCFDCHSQSPHLPWYHSLPGVNWLLESDMREAKEHLDFSYDYPFKGHGSPKEDLEAIHDVVVDKSMPPFRYRLLHGESALSQSDRDIIFKWVDQSQKSLNH